MQLSEKLKIFSEFFIAFSKSRTNFKHFENRFKSQSVCISEIIDFEKRGYLNA